MDATTMIEDRHTDADYNGYTGKVLVTILQGRRPIKTFKLDYSIKADRQRMRIVANQALCGGQTVQTEPLGGAA